MEVVPIDPEMYVSYSDNYSNFTNSNQIIALEKEKQKIFKEEAKKYKQETIEQKRLTKIIGD